MGFAPGQPIIGTRIDVAFIGSCTNGRLSDFEAVAAKLRGRGLRVASHVRALVVPGSRRVRDALVERGLDRVFIDAGFQFRDAGCSLCCGMNADRLKGREVCASSSNRNFRGRQGSPTGRTLLMSPVMVAAAAIAGEVTDARTFFGAVRMSPSTTRVSTASPAVASRIRGDDIDTDQILPARYLTAITFAGMEAHAFTDVRAAAKAQGDVHPLDEPRFAGGSLLLVNRNFGCGSSREHAPQSLHRFGIAGGDREVVWRDLRRQLRLDRNALRAGRCRNNRRAAADQRERDSRRNSCSIWLGRRSLPAGGFFRSRWPKGAGGSSWMAPGIPPRCCLPLGR